MGFYFGLIPIVVWSLRHNYLAFKACSCLAFKALNRSPRDCL